MTEEAIDFGPLKELIGTWYGDKGVDLSPEPDDTERNPYFETIVFSEVGDLDNAEEEHLIAIHYHQIVTRKSTGLVFHNQTGYWMWEPASGKVMHSVAIPRGVCVLACGTFSQSDEDGLLIEVSTEGDFPAVAESAFMNQKATTESFSMRMTLKDGELHYQMSTMLDIYGRKFDHKDMNRLHKKQA